MSEYVFKLPDLGEGTVEAEIAEWMVKVGDAVAEEDAICAMLTDKAAVELTAPVSGTVVSIAGEEGDMVSVGSPLIVFETSGAVPEPAKSKEKGEAEPAEKAEAAEPTPAPAASHTEGSGDSSRHGKVMTSPSIRARAREAGIDLAKIPGSGPRGRILKSDFESFVASGGARAASGVAASAQEARTGTTETKVIGLRRKIAERMAASSSEIPHLSYVEEVDLTP